MMKVNIWHISQMKLRCYSRLQFLWLSKWSLIPRKFQFGCMHFKNMTLQRFVNIEYLLANVTRKTVEMCLFVICIADITPLNVWTNLASEFSKKKIIYQRKCSKQREVDQNTKLRKWSYWDCDIFISFDSCEY